MENKYKQKQFHVRMKFTTYKKLRKDFKAFPKESASSYFERIAKYLAELK